METAVLMRRKPKLAYVVTEDWYFYTHRLPFAQAAQKAGFEVVVITRYGSDAKRIEEQGIRVIPLAISRSGMNPLSELLTVSRLASLLRKEQPDVVHLIALKPVLLGNLAAYLARIPRRISTLAGLGTFFVDSRWSLLAAIIRRVLSQILRHNIVIVQNQDDEMFWVNAGVNAEQIIRLPGVGVDLGRFSPRPEPPGPPTVLLAARMLWTKGIGEFVRAAEILKSSGVNARFVLVGPIDKGNPAAISQRQLIQWQTARLIEWWGYRRDMATVYHQAHVVTLPSYREGLPKVLLEAAASGRPIVATDVPGCREVVKHGHNGLLVPPRDPQALAQALHILIEQPNLRRQMGRRGRELVEQHFARDHVVRRILSIYQQQVSSP